MASLSHPWSWIRSADQAVLLVGTIWWFLLTALFGFAALFWFHALYRNPPRLAAMGRIIIYCAVLGLAYMYTGGRALVYEREDGVYVRAAMVVVAGLIDVLLVHTGSFHCVLHKMIAEWVMTCAIISAVATTLASFVAADEQWAGWFIGAAFELPVPFIWVAQQRRCKGQSGHVIFWTVAWLILRAAYATLQLSGHSFAGKHGMDTTTELALTLVVHTATLCFLVYVFFAATAPHTITRVSINRPTNDNDNASLLAPTTGEDVIELTPVHDRTE